MVRKGLVSMAAAALAACGGQQADDAAPITPADYYGEAMGMNGAQSIAPDDITQDRPMAQAAICPGSTRVAGLDVSVYQGAINWASVRAAGKQFAYIRYSDGAGHLDPNFKANWKNAKAAGLTVGAYQFFRAAQSPTTQADLVIDAVAALGGLGQPNLPIALDVETNDGMSNATVISRVDTWLSRVLARTGRTRPMLYTSPGFWSGLGSPTPNPLPYLWDAHWTSACPTVPSAWGRLRFWQFSDTGRVSGISGAVDLDLYNGSLAELRAL